MDLTPADLRDIEAHGLSRESVERQLRLYRNPPAFSRLVRPCVAGDGITVLGEADCRRYAAVYESQSHGRRIVKFVPASGAASRMFRSLAVVLDEETLTWRNLVERAAAGDDDARAATAVLEQLERFAFFPHLERYFAQAAVAARSEAFRRVLATLLGPDGLDYARLPKGLLAFHRYGHEVRTAFEEHLVEAAAYARGRRDVCRLHLTVSPEHIAGFREIFKRVRERYESRFGVSYEVEHSVQHPSTDSVAVTPDNELFRNREGRPLFRPGGHGALIENLAEIDADLVFVKNIDNVSAEEHALPTFSWKQVLGGVAFELQARAFELLDALGDPSEEAVNAAIAFLGRSFGVAAPSGDGASAGDGLRARTRFAIEHLERPLRVCGMVRNSGDPGGGPFWVRGADGAVSAQIVETSQVDTADPQQRAILAAATHFNPVDLVCAVRDRKGRPFPLAEYVDDDAIFIAHKSHHGRALKSLELPGLWNGAMARWNTVFVEVPLATFNPVKTVNDLLLPAHQPCESLCAGAAG